MGLEFVIFQGGWFGDIFDGGVSTGEEAGIAPGLVVHTEGESGVNLVNGVAEVEEFLSCFEAFD